MAVTVVVIGYFVSLYYIFRVAIYISTSEGDNQLEINYIQTASKRQDHSVHQLHMRLIPANVCALVQGGGGGGGGPFTARGDRL